MSKKYKHKHSKTDDKLTKLHESQEAANEMHRTLLSNNNILSLHEAPAHEDDTSERSYVKRDEDQERIARNTSYATAGSINENLPDIAGMFQSNLSHLMELQLEAMNLFVENCTKLLTLSSWPKSEQKTA